MTNVKFTKLTFSSFACSFRHKAEDKIFNIFHFWKSAFFCKFNRKNLGHQLNINFKNIGGNCGKTHFFDNEISSNSIFGARVKSAGKLTFCKNRNENILKNWIFKILISTTKNTLFWKHWNDKCKISKTYFFIVFLQFSPQGWRLKLQYISFLKKCVFLQVQP